MASLRLAPGASTPPCFPGRYANERPVQGTRGLSSTIENKELTSRFENTHEDDLVGGPSNSESWSDDEDDTSAAPSISPNFRTMPKGGRLDLGVGFNEHQTHIRGAFSVDSGFKFGTPLSRIRDLTSKLPT
ncbi:hypothetical protein AVEN_43717-1 [Araneus ventricosus]|uniref:Uncharacterized protein n=1 Tax=Araneus ventricosus TaxID=182803 RepID=A0A4Y2BXA0_ARAVE|nr:hypothetical protein AVEN_43717-1 [Araneus ventricosus]